MVSPTGPLNGLSLRFCVAANMTRRIQWRSNNRRQELCMYRHDTALQAQLYRHGFAGMALQARLYRHGLTGTALQARLYRQGSTGMSLQAWLCRHGSQGWGEEVKGLQTVRRDKP